MSFATGFTADAQPHAPAARASSKKNKVFAAVPPTVMVRVSVSVKYALRAFSSAGLPDTSAAIPTGLHTRSEPVNIGPAW
jgi:hypothetical protein